MHNLSIVFILLTFLTSVSSSRETQDKPFSPTALAVDQKHKVIAIAGKTANTITLIRLKDEKVIKNITTDLAPTGLVFTKEALWATTSYSKGQLLKIDTKNGITEQVKVGNGACAPVAHPTKPILYIANQYTDDISVVNTDEGREVNRIKVLRQPMAQTISPDGRYLFVANLIPHMRSDIDTVAASVSIIDTEKGIKIKDIQLANGSNALRDIKISPDGKYVFTSHNLGRFQVPTTQLSQGWMNTSAVSVIDAHTLSYIATVILDEPERGAAGSWGIDLSEEELIIAHSGTHDYSRIAYQAFMDKLIQYPNKDELSYDLNFIQDLRQRYPVSGNGPREVLIVDNSLLIANYFSDNIEVIALDKIKPSNGIIALNEHYTPDAIREGEMIFNDASHCFQAWQSCNGCHPNDARVDGLNWDLLNDGTGNPKNCKSLLVSHFTAPSMSTGIRPDAETAVRAGFQHIQFAQVAEEDALKVDAYLTSLKPVPSPYLDDLGQLTDKAVKGQEVYKKASCTACHNGAYYTDFKQHTMGTQGIYDFQNTWDTPTLVEVWRTGPYLHDGRCQSLKEVFTNAKHGIEHQELSDEEIDQLVEYVNSL